MEFERLQDLEPIGDIAIHEASLIASVNEFVPQLRSRNNNERMILPVIHQTLRCAANSAEKHTKRVFYVLAEPSMYENEEDQLADEAIIESVRHDHLIKILVEVKGMGTFPYSMKPLHVFERNFCQLIQQTAMALISGKWKDRVLGALATDDMWYLFSIVDASDDALSQVYLDVNHCMYHTMATPQLARKEVGEDRLDLKNWQQIDEYRHLILFLASYLCTD